MANQENNSWKCVVCGYIHQGPHAPDTCPICGAPQSDFEPHTTPDKPTVSQVSPGSWKCFVCGYIHRGGEPPESCPICQAKADCFEAMQHKEAMAKKSAGIGKVVIVGAGIAGLSAAEAVRSIDPSCKIILINKESALPYYRLNLTRYLAGEISDEDLPIHSQSWYEEKNIQLIGGEEAASIDLQGKAIHLSGNEKESFDRLILTAGAHPFVPPLPGTQRNGVVTLRTVDDARLILEKVKTVSRCICIGGGILGLETAGAIARRGIDVSVIEGVSWLMPRQLNERGGEILARRVEALGIKLYLNSRISEIVGDESVRGVALQDGKVLDAELVIITTGVRPNSYLARLAGLDVNQGVVVDNHLRTSNPNVFAAGDIAEHLGVVYGIWPASQYQGTIAGMNAAGQNTEFAGIPRSNTLKVLGIDVMSIGKVEPEDASYQVFEQEVDGGYVRSMFRDNHLVGAILVGDTSLTAKARDAIEKKVDFSSILSKKPTPSQIAEDLAAKA